MAAGAERKIVEQEAKELPTYRDVRLRMANLGFYGNGVFSNVYKGTLLQKEGNKEIAIKKTWPEVRREKNFELTFLTGEGRRSHKNIIQMLYCFSNQHGDKICEALVFEFMPDTLATVIRERNPTRMDVKLYTWQLFSGLHYLSTMDIVHRDLKPVNVLVDHPFGLLRIGDFGSAKVITPGMESTSYQVTRYYRPPELLMSSRSYDWTADVWSGGCCLGEMLRKRTLLPGKDSRNQLNLVVTELGMPTEQDLRAMGVRVKFDVEKKAFAFRRLCAKAVTEFPEAVELLQKILVYKPKERLCGLKLLADPFFKELFEPGAKRSNGVVVAAIISRTDMQLAEADEAVRSTYDKRKKMTAEETQKSMASAMLNTIKLASCSGSDESTQGNNRSSNILRSKMSPKTGPPPKTESKSRLDGTKTRPLYSKS